MTVITISALFMMSLGIGFIYFVVRENEKPLPEGGIQWTAVVLSALLVVSSGFLLALSILPRGEGATPASDPRADEMDKPAGNFAFRLVADGSEQDLEMYKGKVVLLNFWATWCPPCIQELPDLDRLHKTYAADGFAVLTISDETPDVLQDFANLMPVETVNGYTELASLPEPFRRTMSVGRPVTYVLDRNGYLREFVKGAGNYALFERLVRPYLEEPIAAR